MCHDVEERWWKYQLKANKTLHHIVLQLYQILWVNYLLRNCIDEAHIFPMVNRMLSGRIPRSTTGRSSVISTWQSWDLRFVNFFSAKFKIPFILDEYPDGTFILLK